MTHLYAGAALHRGNMGEFLNVAHTACGLRKAFIFGRVPSDVVESLGAVTCPSCKEKGEAMAQSGKKAT